MLCSTIIPTVGRPSLDRTVTSALAQNLGIGVHEVVVVNDSGKCLEFSDWQRNPQVVVINTNRSERCFARNAGASVSQGEYLHFLDDDDYLLPGGLEALLQVARASGSDVISGSAEIVDAAGQLLHAYTPFCRPNMFADFVVGEVLQLSHTMFRRQAFFQAGGFDPQIIPGQDRDLEARIALTGTFEASECHVARVRVSGTVGSLTDFSRKGPQRMIREKALNLPGALDRILDSVQPYAPMRRRVCRSLLISAYMNVKEKQFLRAVSRMWWCARVAGVYPLLPRFWS